MEQLTIDWGKSSVAESNEKYFVGGNSTKDLTVLSLFSGCGGMDLGFEGGFSVLKRSVNKQVHPSWETIDIDSKWTRLPSTRFATVFANDIRPDAKNAWTTYFGKKNIPASNF